VIITRKTVDTARREGVPFAIRMADGREYVVTAPENIHIGVRHLTLIDNEAFPHVLPYLTITGISYLKPKSKR
jgi:hypothetical protein